MQIRYVGAHPSQAVMIDVGKQRICADSSRQQRRWAGVHIVRRRRGLVAAEPHKPPGSHDIRASSSCGNAWSEYKGVIACDSDRSRLRYSSAGCRRNADHAVAVQVLVETWLQQFQRRATARNRTDDVGDVVAILSVLQTPY